VIAPFQGLQEELVWDSLYKITMEFNYVVPVEIALIPQCTLEFPFGLMEVLNLDNKFV